MSVQTPSPTSSARTSVSPMAGALSLGASTFVAFTSIFVAIIAFVAAAHQTDAVGLARRVRVPSESAQWWAVVVGVAVLVNGFVAGSRARTKPVLAALTSVIFLALTIATWSLFVAAW